MREVKFKIKEGWGDRVWHYFDWHYSESWSADLGNCDKETLCQYIGIQDRNGKDIYEGDIIHIDKNGCSWYVVYGYFCDAKYRVCNGINSGREIEDENNKWVAHITEKEVFELEVIGNIHDNKNI